MRIKLSINRKLHAVIVLNAIFIVVIIAFSYFQLQKAEGTYDDLVDHSGHILVDITRLETLSAQQSSAIRGYLLTREPEMFNSLESSSAKLKQLIDRLNQTITNSEQLGRLKQLSVHNSKLNELFDQQIELVNANKLEAAIRLNNTEVSGLVKQIKLLSQELAVNQQSLIDAEHLKAGEQLDQMIITAVITGIIAIVLSMTIGSYISIRISRRIVSLTARTKRIADGDLTGASLYYHSGDEMEELADSFYQMNDNLKELIVQIGTGSSQVASSACELLAGGSEVAQATKQVTDTIQQMSSDLGNMAQAGEESAKGMEGIGIEFQHIVESIGIVAEMSTVTAAQAEQGNTAIVNAINQMEVIHESVAVSSQIVEMLDQKSREIEQMIANITQFSSQTELLSLNAAIEAAHAGEQGRGFAVVANEIKKLAEHSKLTSQRIVDLVQDIRMDTDRISKGMQNERHEVRTGVTVIHEASEAFKTILTSIQHVTSQAQEVSASAEEIAAVTEEVVASVESISGMTNTSATNSIHIAAIAQQQLASMQEITNSATSLSELATELQAKTSRFKV